MKIILAVNTLASFISHRRGLFLKLRDKHKVLVILPDSEDPKAVSKEIPADQLLGIRFNRKGLNPFAELKTVAAYYSLYRDNKPDLVHHFTPKPVIYGTIAARLAGVPRIVNSITGLGFVFTTKSPKTRILSLLVKALYRLCLHSSNVRVIFQNTDDRDFFIENKICSAASTYLVEGSGVDVHRFQPSATTNVVPTILVASRLLRDKGIFEFMDAMKILKDKGIIFKAQIAGDIDLHNPASATKEQVLAWQEQNLAEFLGLRHDMTALLAGTDICCLPSHREGLSMSLLEAMAAGKPIVTTNAPGCRSTVPAGANGILVPVNDAAALAAALEKLILNAALRESMGAESRKLAVERFSTERITHQIAQVYETY